MADKEATTELELVERVFLKIISAESDDQFGSALNGFLAPILLKISSHNELVKNKIMELLTHINRRLKSRTAIQLPIETLMDQYKDEQVPASVKNFTIIYIKMGYQRAEKSIQTKLIPTMFRCLHKRPTQHQNALLIRILYRLNDVHYPDDKEERMKIFPFLHDPQLVQFVLDFFMDFLLLPYDIDLDMKNPAVLPPPSLSRTSFLRLKSEPIMTREEVETAKLAILEFLSSDLLPAAAVVGHFIAATSDVKHNIADKGESGVRRLSSTELWEDRIFMNKLLKLYQGTLVNQGNLNQIVPSENVRLPSSVRLKLKIFPFFLKSKIIADLNPPICLQVVFEGLFGDNPNKKIKKFALELIHHICWYGSDKTLTFMAPFFYQALCRLSLDKKEDSNLRSLAFAGFVKIARRNTVILKRDTSLIEKFIQLLEVEDRDISTSVQSALSSILPVYSGVTGLDKKMMESMLHNCSESMSPDVRLAGVQICRSVFPSTHISSRYALIIFSDDSQSEVKEMAYETLFPKHGSKVVSYPDYVDLCHYLYDKITNGKMKSNTESFILSSGVATQMLLFLNNCLQEKCDIGENETFPNTLIKLRSFFESLLKDCDIENIWRTSVGRHLYILKYSINHVAGFSVNTLAMQHILPILASLPEILPKLLINDLDMIKGHLISSKEDIRELSAQLFSIVLCCQSTNNILAEVNMIMQKICKETAESDGEILSVGYILSRYWQRNGYDESTELEESFVENVHKVVKQALEIFGSHLKETNVGLSSASCIAIAQIATNVSLPLPDSSFDSKIITKECLVARLSNILNNATDVKLKEKAVLALRSICIGDPTFVYREKIIQSFIDASKLKHTELQFTIGEGFSCLGAGKQSNVVVEKWCLINQNKSDDSCQLETDFMTPLIDRIVKDCTENSVVHVRQAGVIWLFCVVKFSGHHFAVQDNLYKMQMTFVNLLGDNDELVQEIASKGLSIVYDHAKLENKQEVLSILMDRLTSGRKVQMNVENDTRVFEPGMLGRSPDGGNLSTYKELCSLATSLNKPDLMYKFMSLANHHAMWNSRKGAALGFLNVASIASDQLKPYTKEIVPKLYRYQYDPNINVRRAMNNIWVVVAPDKKKTVDEFFKEILLDLLSNITDNAWRTRESSCLALRDLIETCRAEDVISYITTIWQAVFKVLDDIKESVRKSAMSLAKMLSKLSIRLCDVNYSKVGEKAILEVLPVLLDIGLSSKVAEVKTLSLETLVEVSKNSGALMKPHIPVFVIALLESLSGLEPEYLNTLSLQLSQTKEAQEKLDMLRVSSSKSSPMMTAIDSCVSNIDKEVLPQLVPRICDLLKSGLGVGTRVGCASFLISTTMHLKDEMTPFTGKLLGALLNGITTHNIAIKKGYSAAIGHLIKYAKDSSIEKLITKLKKWYLEKDDESLHISCAVCISGMVTYSPDKFYQFSTIALPLVFLAMQGEEEVSSSGETSRPVWTEIWKNNASGDASVIKLYLNEIHAMIEPLFKSPFWRLREKAAKATLMIADILDVSLQNTQLCQLARLLLDAIPGKIWNGKESLLKALSKIFIKCKKVIEGLRDVISIDEFATVLLKECKKENVEYKLCAIQSFINVIEEWKEDKFEDFKFVFESILREGNDEDDHDFVVSESLLCCTFQALGALWPYTESSQEKHFDYVTSIILRNISDSTWKVQLEILKAAIKIIARTNWKSACTIWRSSDDSYQAEYFLHTFIPIVCSSVESSSYSSIRLHCMKVLNSFYVASQDFDDLSTILKNYEGRILTVAKSVDVKNNFEMNTVVTGLIEKIKAHVI